MTEYVISEISNGWILCGPEKPAERIIGGPEPEIYLKTIHAVADILTTWDALGFLKAAARAKEKYGDR